MRHFRNVKMIKKPFYALFIVGKGLLIYMLRPFLYGQLAFLGYTFFLVFLVIVLAGYDEPFSITNGISIWPIEFIRLIAIWLALFLLWRSWLKMQEGEREVEKKLQGIAGFGNNNALLTQDIRKIWRDYKQDGRGVNRFKRIWLPAVIWILICLLIFKVQSPNIPFRGEVAYWADIVIGACSIGVFFILFCFVVDAALHCRQLIQKLIDYDTSWSFMGEKVGYSQKCIDDVKREWKEIQLIAMRTDDISKMVYYPIYVILLLLVAQSDYIDNWDMPYTLVLISTLNVAITLWVAISLRRKALEAREVSLDKIRDIESEVLDFSGTRALTGKERRQIFRQIRFYKAEIEHVNAGAFLPITEQPWLRGMTLMTGGGGSLLLLQYMGG